MSKLFLLMMCLTWFDYSGESKKDSTEDRTALLAGTTQKSWYLVASSLVSPKASCNASAAMSLDNTYTFYANGTFEFDHGTIIDDADCKSEDCCSDLVNITGTWQFTNDQTNLVITALHEKNEPDNKFAFEMYNGAIDQLSDGVLKFSQTDPETNTLYIFEFRKR